MLLPDTSCETAENARRLAEFVSAATLANRETQTPARDRFEQQLDGQTIWWSHAGAAGLIHLEPHCFYVNSQG